MIDVQIELSIKKEDYKEYEKILSDFEQSLNNLGYDMIITESY